jgi:ribosomal protein L37AE/L43A
MKQSGDHAPYSGYQGKAMADKVECPKCEAKLKVIDHSTSGPGGQEKEQGYCPVCGDLVVERMTSGLIAVRLDDGNP